MKKCGGGALRLPSDFAFFGEHNEHTAKSQTHTINTSFFMFHPQHATRDSFLSCLPPDSAGEIGPWAGSIEAMRCEPEVEICEPLLRRHPHLPTILFDFIPPTPSNDSLSFRTTLQQSACNPAGLPNKLACRDALARFSLAFTSGSRPSHPHSTPPFPLHPASTPIDHLESKFSHNEARQVSALFHRPQL